MNGRAEPLVEKRDGRLEGLRATKFGRSISRALEGFGLSDHGHSLELASEVLARLRQEPRQAVAGCADVLRSADIAAVVQHVLLTRGLGGVARLYGHVGRSRRWRHPLATGGRAPQ